MRDATSNGGATTTPWSRLGASSDDEPVLPAGGSIAIIGAGSSGLVAAKHLKEAGYQVTIYERTQHIGGAFVHKAYDDARLVSSKVRSTHGILPTLASRLGPCTTRAAE